MRETNKIFGSIETLRDTGGEYGDALVLSHDTKAEWIAAALAYYNYATLSREDKGAVRTYLQRVTGYSRAQVARYILAYQKKLRSKAPAAAALPEGVPAHGFLWGKVGLCASVLLLLLLTQSAKKEMTADVLNILNAEKSELLSQQLGLPRERMTIVKTVYATADAQSAPLLAIGETSIPAQRQTTLREVSIASTVEALKERVAERRLLRSRVLVARPDIFVPKEMFPPYNSESQSGMIAAVRRTWDIPVSGSEGQILMIKNGKPSWRNFPYIEQIHSAPPHGDAPPSRVGGRRGGGGGGGGGSTSTSTSTTTTIIQTTTAADSGWTDDTSIVYLTNSSALVGIGTSAPSNQLEVVGSISGASLYITRSMSGAGLTDCDAANQTLQWDSATGQFSCGADDGGAGSTYSAGRGLGLSVGNVFTLNSVITGSLLEFTTVSGATVYGANTLRSSGSLVFEGAASGASLYIATSINGAGLADCDAATQTLAWDATSGRFSCGTDSDTTYTAGQNLALNGTAFSLNTTITGALLEFSTVSGSLVWGNTLRSSGSLVFEGAASGASLYIATSINGAGLADCDAATQTLAWDATSGRFSCGTDSDTTYTPGQGLTLNGTSFRLNAAHTGTVILATTTLASSGSLVWEGAASGASLYIATSMNGAGLADCDVAGTSKLLWDASTGRFSCGSDQNSGTSYTAGQNLALNGTAFSLNTTITGSLLEFTTVSGATVYGANTVRSSGSLVFEGAGSGASLYIATSFQGAGLSDCDAATQTLAWDATSGRFSCGTDSDTTYTAGQNLTLNGTAFSLNTTITGALLEFTTVSGSLVWGNTLRSSGSLVFEGAASGASLYIATSINGAGLADCDAALTSKLLWDASTGRFSCGTDQTGGSSLTAGEGLTLTSTSLSLSDTISGALLEFTTVSGSLVWGNTLRSSGSLVFEGAASGASLYIATSFQGAGLSDCDASSQTLNWDATTGRFSCGTDESAGTGLDINTGDARYVNTAGDSMSGALAIYVGSTQAITADAGLALEIIGTASGRVMYAQNTLVSSGTLLVESGAIIDGTTFVVDAGANRVGIGTSSPTVPLDVHVSNTEEAFRVRTGATSLAIISGDGGGQDGRLDILNSGVTSIRLTADSADASYINAGNFVIGATTADSTLEVIGTASGRVIRAQDTLASSGSLVFEGAGSGASLYIATSINGAGLADCDAALTSKLLWDASTGRFSCGSDQTGGGSLTAGEGLTLTSTSLSLSDTISGALLEFATVSGSLVWGNTLRSSGSLVFEGAASGASLYIATSINGAGLADCDAAASTLAWDATSGRFSCGTDSDTTYTAGQNLAINGTAFSLNTTMTGALLEFTTVSGATVYGANTVRSSGSLVFEGAASGASLYIATSINGAGLADCDAALTSKLLWDASTGRFSCGSDQTGGSSLTAGEGLTLTSTSLSLSDTISGALLEFTTVSGSTIFGNNRLVSSGTLLVESGAIIDGTTFVVDAGTNRVGVGITPTDTFHVFNTTNGATIARFEGSAGNISLEIQGISSTEMAIDMSSSDTLRFNDPVEFLRIASGTSLRAQDSLASSGTLVFEGAASGASLYIATSINGAGLSDCDAALTSKLLWDASTGRFSCGSDQSGSSTPEVGTSSFSGGVLRLGDSRYVNTAGDTMSGALAIYVGSTQSIVADAGLALEVIGTASGRIMRAQDTLASSGTLVFEGAASGASLYIATSINGAGLSDCDLATQTLAWDATSGRFSCGTDSDTTYTAGEGLTLTSTSFSLSDTISGTLLEFTTVSGATVFGTNRLISSGTLLVESGATIDGTTFVLNANSNRVGIGTALPTVALDIVGSLQTTTQVLAGGTTSNPPLSFADDTDTGFHSSGDRMEAIVGGTIWFEYYSDYFRGMAGGAVQLYRATSTAATPGLSFISDADTGIFHSGAGNSDVFGIATNGIERVRFGTGVAIGTTAPGTSRLTVSGSVIIGDNIGSASSDIGLALEIIGTASGRILRAQNTLASSGTLVFEGAASGASLYIATSIQGAGLADCDVAGSSKLLWDATSGRFSCGTDQTSNVTAGEGLTLTSTSLSLSDTISGTLLEFTTVSGATVFGTNRLISSGTLLVESGAIIDGTTFVLDAGTNRVGIGTAPAATFHAFNTTTNATIGRFEGISGNVDLSIVGISSTEMAINMSSSDTLRINNLVEFITGASGSLVRAQNTLASSGTLVWEGIGSGNALNLAGGNIIFTGSGTTTFNELGNNVDVRMESDTNEALFYLDASTNRIGIGKNDPKAMFDILGMGSGSKLFASMSLASSGMLVIESTAKNGSGAASIIAAEFQTGAYFYASGAAVLALDTYNKAGSGAAAHILFGYRGLFDTRLARTSTGNLTLSSASGMLMSLDTERSDATGNIFQIFSDVTSDENRVLRIQANGAVFSDGAYASTGADYAEWFMSKDNLVAGEVVCIDITKQNSVQRCESDADSNVMGIVSSNPAFVGNMITGAGGIMPPGYYLIGLIGQVPAHVKIENNEAIRPGDSLTAGSTPGYARKARAGESTVGVALEGLESGEGVVNVLISRRNQSMTVEAVEEKVLNTIASMEIEDEVQLMVAATLEDLNVDEQITTEVERQLSQFENQALMIDAIKFELANLKAELEALKTASGGVSGVTSVGQNISATTLELERTLSTGGDARVGGDLYIDGSLKASSLLVPNGLVIDGGVTLNGELAASSLAVSSSAYIQGSLTLGGDLVINGNIRFNSGSLRMSDLTVENSLFVMGDLTIQGLAEFLGDLHVKGELMVSNNQAGFAMIPKSGTSVTVHFGTGFKATPVVTASSDIPVLYGVAKSSSTGFTIHIAAPAEKDITFSWHALSTGAPITIRAEVTDAGTLVFPIDSNGVPVSSQLVWNACIRNITLLDESGQPYSCSRYHDNFTWTHPDLAISFLWNTSVTPALLNVPDGYTLTVTETAESVTASFTTPNGEPIPDTSSEEESEESDLSAEASAKGEDFEETGSGSVTGSGSTSSVSSVTSATSISSESSSSESSSESSASTSSEETVDIIPVEETGEEFGPSLPVEEQAESASSESMSGLGE